MNCQVKEVAVCHRWISTGRKRKLLPRSEEKSETEVKDTFIPKTPSLFRKLTPSEGRNRQGGMPKVGTRTFDITGFFYIKRNRMTFSFLFSKRSLRVYQWGKKTCYWRVKHTESDATFSRFRL